jgi:hypothetical protein
MIRPANPAFHTSLQDDPDHLLPRRSFIPVECFRCHRPEPLENVMVPTDNPCFVCISCISPRCKRAARMGALRFIRCSAHDHGVSIDVVDSITTYKVNVKRSSGQIESDWMIKGFYFNDEGAVAVSVMKQDWSLIKRISIDEFLQLNPFIAKMERDSIVNTGEGSIMLQGLVDHLVDSILDDAYATA